MKPNTETIKCHACGRPWHPHLIDAKPNPDDPENFTVLEGPCCYGPGWVPTCTYAMPEVGLTQEMLDEAMTVHKSKVGA